MYKGILKAFGETEGKIESLIEIKDTGITIERFKRILKKHNYNLEKETLYFINPNYETKFGIKPRVQSKLLTSIPYFKNYFVTAMYAVVSSD
jgi:hypoxanthine phosphoribosyltransferase